MDDEHTREYDCAECGRHMIQFGGPFTGLCGACLIMPRWFDNPELAACLDPDNEVRPPSRRVN